MRAPDERQGARMRSAAVARLLDGFRVLFCPVTGLIMRRDPPAAMSMLIIGICALLGVARPGMFCFQKRTNNRTIHPRAR